MLGNLKQVQSKKNTMYKRKPYEESSLMLPTVMLVRCSSVQNKTHQLNQNSIEKYSASFLFLFPKNTESRRQKKLSQASASVILGLADILSMKFKQIHYMCIKKKNCVKVHYPNSTTFSATCATYIWKCSTRILGHRKIIWPLPRSLHL